MQKPLITRSQFYMWRTLFALAHVDSIVSAEEVRFMAEALEDIPFSPEQRLILEDDIKHGQDVEGMFFQITDLQDQSAFFRFARNLVHVDGDFGPEEQKIMLRLQEMHLKRANVDDLVGAVGLELEDDAVEGGGHGPHPLDASDWGKGRSRFKNAVYSFRQAFLTGRFGK